MGFGMAANIRQKMPAGSTLFVNDVNRAACEKFVASFSSHGPIKVLDSAREVAENATNIISIVPTAQHVKQVYLDTTVGVIAASRNADRLMMECSTIDSQSSKDVGEKLKEAGVGEYIDTPVSGGQPGARDGTLSFMVGYEKDQPGSHSKRLHELMTMMGSPERFYYCGTLGAGLTAKIVNNYLCGVNLLASAEAMNFGLRSGIDKNVLYQVVRNSSGQSWMLDHVNPVPGVLPSVPSSRNYEGGFKAQMMVKDMTLGVDAGAATGVRTTTGSAALEIYKEASTDPRCIDRDASVIYRFLDGPE